MTSDKPTTPPRPTKTPLFPTGGWIVEFYSPSLAAWWAVCKPRETEDEAKEVLSRYRPAGGEYRIREVMS